MPSFGVPAAEPHLKSASHRAQELEALLARALDIHGAVSEAMVHPTRWDAASSLQALSEVLVGVIDIVRAQHGVYDHPDVPEMEDFDLIIPSKRAYAA